MGEALGTVDHRGDSLQPRRAGKSLPRGNKARRSRGTEKSGLIAAMGWGAGVGGEVEELGSH